jgi:Ca2+-binding RTX toxin-like protein
MVRVTVTPVNDVPIAVDDSATTDQGEPVTFSPLVNDADPDGDVLQLVSVAGASGGSVQINADGSVTYTPNAGFAGGETLIYTVRDPGGAQASALITVQVDPIDTVDGPETPDGGDLPVTVPGTEGNDRLTGTASDDIIDGYGGDDVLQGRSGNDVIRGNAGNDDIWGDYKGKNRAPGGDDSLFGGDGDDRILGQKGDDEIFGGAGNDTLKGQAGSDEIDGGGGDDSLNGGGGGDRFVFAPGFGRDTIADFGRGADILDLTAFLVPGFAVLDEDGDGRIETGEGGGIFTATVGSETILDFGGGNVLTLQGATNLGADDFDW